MKIKNKKHHPLYRRWTHIRCCVSNQRYRESNHIPDDIEIECDWKDFESFVEDIERHLGQQPGPEYVLNRKDTRKGWFIKNLQWASRKQMAQHQRSTIRLKYRNQTKCLSAWCEQFGVNKWTAKRRYLKGLKFREIFSQ